MKEGRSNGDFPKAASGYEMLQSSKAESLKLYRIREHLGMSRMATGLRLPVLALISPSFGFLALVCCDVRL